MDTPIIGENDKVPAVFTQAVKILHPLFQDPTTGAPLPPPPDHELRVVVQISIAPKGKVVQESPGIFFVSGDDPEEMAEVVKDILKQGLEQVRAENSVIQAAPPEALSVLEKFGEQG
jgi:hypothetical protein